MPHPFVCRTPAATVYPRLDRRDQLRRRNEVVNWDLFRPRLEQIWRPEHRKSSAGRKPWDAVLICKMLILAVLYEMSDAETEFQADDRYTFRRFLGWDETAPVPDEKTLWRYRNEWVVAGAMRARLDDLNAYLGALGCTPQGGQMIDSSFVLAPKQRRTRAERRVSSFALPLFIIATPHPGGAAGATPGTDPAGVAAPPPQVAAEGPRRHVESEARWWVLRVPEPHPHRPAVPVDPPV